MLAFRLEALDLYSSPQGLRGFCMAGCHSTWLLDSPFLLLFCSFAVPSWGEVQDELKAIICDASRSMV